MYTYMYMPIYLPAIRYIRTSQSRLPGQGEAYEECSKADCQSELSGLSVERRPCLVSGASG